MGAATSEKVSTYIHEDIAFSILSKLPLKSFKRFECVRKSWSLLFQNHGFMNMFRTNFLSNLHSCSYYDQASLLLKLAGEHQELLYSLSGERFENKVKLDRLNPFTNNAYFPIFGFGSVNGMFCLHECCSDDKHVLWNPATNEFNVIPRSPVEFIESTIPEIAKDLVSVGVVSYLQGFGYDSVTDDYKLIRYVCFVGDIHDAQLADVLEEFVLRDVSLDSVWEVYSLRSNSWRKLDVDMPYSLECKEGTQVYMDGVCHWLCEDDYESSEKHNSPSGPCLVSFYLNNEVFFVTPIPSDLDDCFDIEALWINLAVLNGSIALISYHEEMSTFHISILGELAVKESWTKLFIVRPLPCVERPIGVGTKGEIFFIRKDAEIVWLDLSTQMIEVLGYKGGGLTTRMVIYKGNILQIAGISN